MTEALLDTFTRQYIEAQQVPEVTFNWQGIEPLLMGPEFFQQVVNLQHKYRRPEMTIYNILQTNGLLLDDNWCRFFKANGFLIVIGIDGPGDQHDSVRVDNDGQPTLERVLGRVLNSTPCLCSSSTLLRIRSSVGCPLLSTLAESCCSAGPSIPITMRKPFALKKRHQSSSSKRPLVCTIL